MRRFAKVLAKILYKAVHKPVGRSSFVDEELIVLRTNVTRVSLIRAIWERPIALMIIDPTIYPT